MKTTGFFVVLVAITGYANAQTIISAGKRATETFNSLGSGIGPIPANWKMSGAGRGNTANWSTSTNITTTTQVPPLNAGIPTAGGAFNWGSIEEERSLGFMTSPGYRSPNSIMSYYRNGTGATINQLTVSFSVRQFVSNYSNFSLSFWSSTDGSTWAEHSTGNIFGGLFEPNSAATNGTPYSVHRNVIIDGLTIPANGDFYLRWIFVTGPDATSQGAGLDNVSVYAVVNPAPSLTTTLKDTLFLDNIGNNQLPDEGDVLSYKITVKNTGSGTARDIQIPIAAPAGTSIWPTIGLRMYPVANNDTFTTPANTALEGVNVLTNDMGIPFPSVFTYGQETYPYGAGAGGQTLTDNNCRFSIQASGLLTYSPKAGFAGIDKFIYRILNSSGPLNDATVTITVGSPAKAIPDTYNVVGNVGISTFVGLSGLLDNDEGSNPFINAVNDDPLSVDKLVPTAKGGTVQVNRDGGFDYTPPLGYAGIDSFSYLANNGFSIYSRTTVTLNITGVIWFVDANAAPDGDGSLKAPFNTLDNFAPGKNNSKPGDVIFVYGNASAYLKSNIALLPGQKLIGQTASQSLAAITGFPVEAYSEPLPVTNPGGPGVTLINTGTIIVLSPGGGNLVDGLTLAPTSGNAIELSGVATGNHTISEVIIAANGGSAVALNTTTYNGTFNYTSGSISCTSRTITHAFTANNCSGNISFAVPITYKGGADAIRITNGSGGTIEFTKPVDIEMSGSTAAAIELSNNKNTTINFREKLSAQNNGTDAVIKMLNNTGSFVNITGNGLFVSGSSGLIATGGGTITVTGTGNIIKASDGAALNLTNTTIGAAGLTFEIVSSSGTTTGIILDNTGNSAGLTVTGDGKSTLPGGNATGGNVASIYLNNTRDVILRGMRINPIGQPYAISGSSVTNFNLEYCQVIGIITPAGISFTDSPGNAVINNCIINGATRNNLDWTNRSGILNASITNSTIGSSKQETTIETGDAINMVVGGTAVMNVNIESCTIRSAGSNLIYYNNLGSGISTFTLKNSTLLNDHGAIGGGSLNAGGVRLVTSADMDFNIDRNTFKNAVGDAIFILKLDQTSNRVNVVFNNNQVGDPSIANSGSKTGSDLVIRTNEGNTMNATVTNNRFYQYNVSGLLLQAGGASASRSGNFNALITGNFINHPGNNLASEKTGLNCKIGAGTGDSFMFCAKIGGGIGFTNNIQGSGTTNDFVLQQGQNTTFRIQGYTGGNNDNPAVVNYIKSQNSPQGPPTGTASNTVGAGGMGFLNSPNGLSCL